MKFKVGQKVKQQKYNEIGIIIKLFDDPLYLVEFSTDPTYYDRWWCKEEELTPILKFKVGDEVKFIDPNISNEPFPIATSGTINKIDEECDQLPYEVHFTNLPNRPSLLTWVKEEWLIDPNSQPIKKEEQPLNCRECGILPMYHQVNCSDGGFLCYGCRGSKRWKYEGLLVK